MVETGLSSDVTSAIIAVLSRHPAVDKAILYGSRAMGTYRKGSDIDLTLQGLQLDEKCLRAITRALDDLGLAYKIDLSLYCSVRY